MSSLLWLQQPTGQFCTFVTGVWTLPTVDTIIFPQFKGNFKNMWQVTIADRLCGTLMVITPKPHLMATRTFGPAISWTWHDFTSQPLVDIQVLFQATTVTKRTDHLISWRVSHLATKLPLPAIEFIKLLRYLSLLSIEFSSSDSDIAGGSIKLSWGSGVRVRVDLRLEEGRGLGRTGMVGRSSSTSVSSLSPLCWKIQKFYHIISDTLSDVIWSDVIWAIFAEVPTTVSDQIMSVHSIVH